MKIFLNGFMGSGKSYWGKIWSEVSGLDYFDLDDMIEQQEGMTVDAIFEKKGESYFREKENDMLRSFSGKDNCIVSCGGGTPCFSENMQWMNGQGITVYLQTTPVKLLENIMLELGKRPMLKNINKGEMLFFIEQKLKERSPFYLQATKQLDVTLLTSNSIKDIINSGNHS
jgi:shikimate kinase